MAKLSAYGSTELARYVRALPDLPEIHVTGREARISVRSDGRVLRQTSYVPQTGYQKGQRHSSAWKLWYKSKHPEKQIVLEQLSHWCAQNGYSKV